MASIQETLRAVLGADGAVSALVGDRIYPGQVPDDEVPSPWLYYALPESTPFDELSGGSDVTAQVEFHALADSYAVAKQIIDAVAGCLNTYTGGQVTLALWRGTSEEVTEVGYHHVARYDVNGTVANLVAAGIAVGKITTGPDSITLSVAGQTVTLDADGLRFDHSPAHGFSSTPIVLGNDGSLFVGGPTATVTAAAFVGDGSGLTGLPAPDLTPYALLGAANTYTAKQTIRGASAGAVVYEVRLADDSTWTIRLSEDGTITTRNLTVSSTFTATIVSGGSLRGSFCHDAALANPYLWLADANGNGTITAVPRASNQVPFTTRAVSGQTADLQQWQASTGAVQFAVGPAGQLKTNQTSAAATPGSVVRKLPVYDAAGTLLGYVPLYNSIT